MSGERTGRPGKVPLALAGVGGGGGGGTGQQPQIHPNRLQNEGVRLRREPSELSNRDSPEGLALGEGGSGKLLAASGPILCSGVSFALLGIDPQRPLVDSLIEN